jgi:hypothetical protein
MKAVDIADEIHRELGSPTDLGIAAISFWVRSNVGALNNHLNTNYEISQSTYEILQDSNGPSEGTAIGINEVAVLKKMYEIHYYDGKLKTVLTAATTDAVIALSSDGSSIKKVNKNEQGKLYASARNRVSDELSIMTHSYKINDVQPLQVAGDDDQSAYILPNREYIRITKY